MEWLNSADWIEAGGPVMLILGAMSILALAIVLIKVWQFSVGGALGGRQAAEAVRQWRAGEGRAALATAEHGRGPVAKAVAVAMRGQLERQPEARVREEVTRVAAANLEDLRSHMRALEVIASLSPLLGLLGTVLGMIEAFQNLQAAGAQVDPTILSGGIWVALLTTAAGLAVAIPAVMFVNLFERLLERVRHRIEDSVTQVFTHPLPRLQAERAAA